MSLGLGGNSTVGDAPLDDSVVGDDVDVPDGVLSGSGVGWPVALVLHPAATKARLTAARRVRLRTLAPERRGDLLLGVPVRTSGVAKLNSELAEAGDVVDDPVAI